MSSIGAQITKFGAKTSASKFAKIVRSDIKNGLLDRQKQPWLIRQKGEMLCGPSALMFHIARDDFDAYANYVMDLYDHGTAKLGKIEVTPSDYILNYSPSTDGIPAVDWIAMASLRDSENLIVPRWLLNGGFGVTGPQTLERWYRDGYGSGRVIQDCDWTVRKNLSVLIDVDVLIGKGYIVTLFSKGAAIGHLSAEDAYAYHTAANASHWMPLVSGIEINGKPAREYNHLGDKVNDDETLLRSKCFFVVHSYGKYHYIERSTWAVLALFFGAIVA